MELIIIIIDMKRVLSVIFVFCFLIGVVNGQTITGGVQYSAQDALIELRNNIPEADFFLTSKNYVDTNHQENYSSLLKGITKLNDRTLGLFSDDTYAINYYNDPKHVWYYDKSGTLINTEIKTSLSYPYRSYKYTPEGELVNMSMRVSENETFIFSPLGKLLGHWVNENCYDESGKVIMTRKIVK